MRNRISARDRAVLKLLSNERRATPCYACIYKKYARSTENTPIQRNQSHSEPARCVCLASLKTVLRPGTRQTRRCAVDASIFGFFFFLLAAGGDCRSRRGEE